MSHSLWANLKNHKHTALVTPPLPACGDQIATFQEAAATCAVYAQYTLKLLQNIACTFYRDTCIFC